MLRLIFFVATLFVGGGLAAAEPLHGQFRPDPWQTVRSGTATLFVDSISAPETFLPRLPTAGAASSEDRQTRSAAPALLGSAGGWVGGAILGCAIGAVIDGDTTNEYWPISSGATMGAVAGMVVGPPAGAHLANRRQGNVAVSSLASIGTVAGMMLLVSTDAVEPGLALGLTPLVQVAVTGLVEHYTAH